MQDKPLHITTLELSNFKRIRAFSVGLNDGEPLILTGDNGAGKSSVLDAVFMALTGDGLNDPIRRGASKATINLVLGDGQGVNYEIEKRITPKGASLYISDADKNQIKSPQAFLDSLVGTLAFDPLEFSRMGRDAKGRKAQAAIIRDLTGLNTDKLDAEYAKLFAERTVANRTLAEAEAKFKGVPRPEIPAVLTLPEIPPFQWDEAETSASSLITKRDAMMSAAQDYTQAMNAVTQSDDDVKSLQATIEEVRAQLKRLEQSLLEAEADREANKAKAEALRASSPSDADLSAITQQITDIDAINAGIRARREAAAEAHRQAVKERDDKQRNNADAIRIAEAELRAWLSMEQDVKDASERADAYTARLDSIKAEKTALTAEAKMPVEGMTFDESGVMINGLPFDQLSTAEQIRTSALVAMASNPKLRIILIREGALVNKANLKVIFDAAKDRGYQILIEKFAEEAGDEGLHIVDGAVTAIDGQPV